MKKGIHPDYVECKVTCTCGNTFTTRSTKSELKIDICNKCHPFFSGTQKLIDSGGRVERFENRFGDAKALLNKKAAEKKAARTAELEQLEASRKEKAEAKAAAKAERTKAYEAKAKKAAEAAAKEQAEKAPKAPEAEEVNKETMAEEKPAEKSEEKKAE